jgi:hypothetical protein
MANRKPIDIALSIWARLTVIKQCSLAILDQAASPARNGTPRSKEGSAAATRRSVFGESRRLKATGMTDQGHAGPKAPDKLDAADEIRWRIDDMNLRIMRQRRRIESQMLRPTRRFHYPTWKSTAV